MATTLTASSTQMLKQVSAPQDGVDNVEQSSVNPTFQNILNNTYYIARADSHKRPEVSWRATTTSVVINPFAGVWVSSIAPAPPSTDATWFEINKDTTTTLTSANIEGGGAFANTTAYYIYMYTTGIGATPTALFEFSTSAPDPTLIYKSVAGVPQINRRYFGHIVTDGAGAILESTMVNFRYTFNPIQLTPTITLSGATTTQTSDYNAPSPFPVAAIKRYLCKLDVQSNEITGNSFATLRPKGTTGGFVYTIFPFSAVQNIYYSYYAELGIGTSSQLTLVAVKGGMVGDNEYRLYFSGYEE